MTAPCAANTLSDFRKEPSPRGRGGKMLEETLPRYSFGYAIASCKPQPHGGKF